MCNSSCTCIARDSAWDVRPQNWPWQWAMESLTIPPRIYRLPCLRICYSNRHICVYSCKKGTQVWDLIGANTTVTRWRHMLLLHLRFALKHGTESTLTTGRQILATVAASAMISSNLFWVTRSRMEVNMCGSRDVGEA